jgi:hypothetical protein
MKQFILEMLSSRETISSKRSAMWWFIFVFTGLLIYNAITGKSPSESFQLQLFEVLITLILLVFGEKALKAWQVIKGKKVDLPNAQTPGTEAEK